MSAQPHEKHFSVRTVCELYDLSESKIRRAIGKQPGQPGYLRSVLVGLDSRRIPESALQEWLRQDAPEAKLADVHSLDERRK